MDPQTQSDPYVSRPKTVPHLDNNRGGGRVINCGVKLRKCTFSRRFTPEYIADAMQ